MGKFNNPIYGFQAGELSEDAYGRVDLPQFRYGAKRLLNMVPLKHGPAPRRAGTQYVAHTTTANDRVVQLIPFISSYDDAAFMIGLRAGNVPIVYDRSGSVQPASLLDAWSIGAGSTGVQYAQSADVLWAVHQSYEPGKIYRFADGTFLKVGIRINPLTGATYLSEALAGTASSASALRDIFPFLATNTNTAQTITLSAATVGTGRTLTFASAHGYDSTIVGAIFRVETGYIQITARTSATVLTGSVFIVATGGVGPYSDWAESAWSNFRGWPRSVCFFLDRIVFAGTKDNPDTLWLSKNGNYSVLRQPASPSATDAVSQALPSRSLNKVQWMEGKEVLMVGTTGSEFKVAGPIAGNSVIDMTPATAHGGSHVMSKLCNNAVLFLDRSGRRIREALFDFNSNSYIAEDLTALASHIIGANASGETVTALDLAWQESDSTLWCVASDGTFYALGRDRKTGSSAWSRHYLGGTIAIAKAVATLPNEYGTDDVWIACWRNTSGGTLRYTVEVMRERFKDSSLDSPNIALDEAHYAPVFLDCAILSDNQIITGLDVLEGETVGVLADGFDLGDFVVTAGQIDLGRSYDFVIVGIRYPSIAEILPIEAGSAIGSSQGSIMQINRATARFKDTVSAKIGQSESSLQEIPFRRDADPADEPIPLFTGDKTIDFSGDAERGTSLVVSTDRAYPMTLCALFVKGSTSDG